MFYENPSISDKESSIKVSEGDCFDPDNQSQTSNSLSSFDVDVFNDNVSNEGNNYPKICSMCYLSESSMLGQGHLLRYEPTDNFDVFNIELSQSAISDINKKVLQEKIGIDDYSKGSKPIYSVRRSRGSKNFLKLKKKNSHFTQDPPGLDELKAIGFPPCLDINAFFEKTGHTWAHEFCALWSNDVIKSRNLEDKILLSNVDKAVINGITQQCVICKNFGATIYCHVETCHAKFHLPCATSSGCLLYFSIKATICFDHLKLSKELGCNIVCKLCLKDGKLEEMLSCVACGTHCHYNCLLPLETSNDLSPHFRSGWQCIECKSCQVCKLKDDKTRVVICDDCDKAFHIHCLKPPLLTIPKNGWKCKNCRICMDCGSRTPGSGPSSRWHLNFSVCDSCYQQRNKGLCCPICKRAYRQHYANKDKMTKCGACHKYIHNDCDSEATKTENYRCLLCVHNDKPLVSSPLQFSTSAEQYTINTSKDSSKNAYVENIFEIGKKTASYSPNTNTPHGSSLGSPPSVKLTLKHVDNKYMVVIHDSPTSSNKPNNAKSTFVPNLPNSKELFQIKTEGSPSQFENENDGAGDRKTTPDKFSDLPNHNNSMHKTENVSTTQLENSDVIVPEQSSEPNNVINDEDMGSDITLDPPSVDEDDDDPSTIPVLFSISDKFTYYQDICASCGSFGIEQEALMLFCYQCGQSYHPFCVSIKLTRTIALNGWRCYKCLICEGCGKTNDESRLLLCDDCDISYHIYCLNPPLLKIPEGSWKCHRCVICHTCSSRIPGTNCSWSNNYTQCGPCASHDACPQCNKRYQDTDIILECSTCLRWVHGHCEHVKDEWEAAHIIERGFSCRLCTSTTMGNALSKNVIATLPPINVATFKHGLHNKRGHTKKQFVNDVKSSPGPFGDEKSRCLDLKLPLATTERIYDFDVPATHKISEAENASNNKHDSMNAGGLATNLPSSLSAPIDSSMAKSLIIPEKNRTSLNSYIADIVRSVIGSADNARPHLHLSKNFNNFTNLMTASNARDINASLLDRVNQSPTALPLCPSKKSNVDGINLTDKGLQFIDDLVHKKLIHTHKTSFASSHIQSNPTTSLCDPKYGRSKLSHSEWDGRKKLAFHSGAVGQLNSGKLTTAFNNDAGPYLPLGGDGHGGGIATINECFDAIDEEKPPPYSYQRRASNKIGSGIGGFFVKPKKPLTQGQSPVPETGIIDGPTPSLQGEGVSLHSFDQNELNALAPTDDVMILNETFKSEIPKGIENSNTDTALNLFSNNSSSSNNIVKRKRITKKRGYIAETYPYYLQELFFGETALKRGSALKLGSVGGVNNPNATTKRSNLSPDEDVSEFLDNYQQAKLNDSNVTDFASYQLDPDVEPFHMFSVIRRFLEPSIPFQCIMENVNPGPDQNSNNFKFNKNRAYHNLPYTSPQNSFHQNTSVVLQHSFHNPQYSAVVRPRMPMLAKDLNGNVLNKHVISTMASLLLDGINGNVNLRGRSNLPPYLANMRQSLTHDDSRFTHKSYTAIGDSGSLVPNTLAYKTLHKIYNPMTPDKLPILITTKSFIGSETTLTKYNSNRNALENYMPIVTTLPQMNTNDIEALLGNESDFLEIHGGPSKNGLFKVSKQVTLGFNAPTSTSICMQSTESMDIYSGDISPQLSSSLSYEYSASIDDACLLAHSPFTPDQFNQITSSTQKNLQRWLKDEALGTLATISPVLYANIRHPQLKSDCPDMIERSKQIAKLWRNITPEERIPFLQKARENRAILRVQKSQQKTLEHQILTSMASFSSERCQEGGTEIKMSLPESKALQSEVSLATKEILDVIKIKEEYVGQISCDDHSINVSIKVNENVNSLVETTLITPSGISNKATNDVAITAASAGKFPWVVAPERNSPNFDATIKIEPSIKPTLYAEQTEDAPLIVTQYNIKDESTDLISSVTCSKNWTHIEKNTASPVKIMEIINTNEIMKDAGIADEISKEQYLVLSQAPCLPSISASYATIENSVVFPLMTSIITTTFQLNDPIFLQPLISENQSKVITSCDVSGQFNAFTVSIASSPSSVSVNITMRSEPDFLNLANASTNLLSLTCIPSSPLNSVLTNLKWNRKKGLIVSTDLPVSNSTVCTTNGQPYTPSVTDIDKPTDILVSWSPSHYSQSIPSVSKPYSVNLQVTTLIQVVEDQINNAGLMTTMPIPLTLVYGEKSLPASPFERISITLSNSPYQHQLHHKLSGKSSQLLDDILSDLSSIEETKSIFKDISCPELLEYPRPLVQTPSYHPGKTYTTPDYLTKVEYKFVPPITWVGGTSQPLVKYKSPSPLQNKSSVGVILSRREYNTTTTTSSIRLTSFSNDPLPCTVAAHTTTGPKYKRDLKRDHQRLIDDADDPAFRYYPTIKRLANADDENIMGQIDFDKLNEVFGGGTSGMPKTKPMSTYHASVSHAMGSIQSHAWAPGPSNPGNSSTLAILINPPRSDAVRSNLPAVSMPQMHLPPYQVSQSPTFRQFKNYGSVSVQLTTNAQIVHQYAYHDVKQQQLRQPSYVTCSAVFPDYANPSFYPNARVNVDLKSIALHPTVATNVVGQPSMLGPSSGSFQEGLKFMYTSLNNTFEQGNKILGNSLAWPRKAPNDPYVSPRQMGGDGNFGASSSKLHTNQMMNFTSPHKSLIKTSQKANNNMYIIAPNDSSVVTKQLIFSPNNNQSLHPYVCDKTLSSNLFDPNLSEIQTDDPSVYQNWLLQRDALLQENLTKMATDIAKLRKRKKSLASKQRQLRKTGDKGSDLPEQEARELAQLNVNIAAMQKHIEALRKEIKQHKTLISDFQMKEDREKSNLTINYPIVQSLGIEVCSAQIGISTLLPTATQYLQVTSSVNAPMLSPHAFPSPNPILSPNVQFSSRQMYRMTSPSIVSSIQFSPNYSTPMTKQMYYGNDMASFNPTFKNYLPVHRMNPHNFSPSRRIPSEAINPSAYNSQDQMGLRYPDANVPRLNSTYQQCAMFNNYNGSARNVEGYGNVPSAQTLPENFSDMRYSNNLLPTTGVHYSVDNQFGKYGHYGALHRLPTYAGENISPRTPTPISNYDVLSSKYGAPFNTSLYQQDPSLSSPRMRGNVAMQQAYDEMYKNIHAASPNRYVSPSSFRPSYTGSSTDTQLSCLNNGPIISGQFPDPNGSNYYFDRKYKDGFNYSKGTSFQMSPNMSYTGLNYDTNFNIDMKSPPRPKSVVNIYSSGTGVDISEHTINSRFNYTSMSNQANMPFVTFRRSLTEANLLPQYTFALQDNLMTYCKPNLNQMPQTYTCNSIAFEQPYAPTQQTHFISMCNNRGATPQQHMMMVRPQQQQFVSHPYPPDKYHPQLQPHYNRYGDNNVPRNFHYTACSQNTLKQSYVRSIPHAPPSYNRPKMPADFDTAPSHRAPILPPASINTYPSSTTPNASSSSVARFLLCETVNQSGQTFNDVTLPCSAYTIFGLGNVDKSLALLDNKFGSFQLAILPNYYGEFPCGRFTMSASHLLHANVMKKSTQKHYIMQHLPKLEKILPFAPSCLHIKKEEKVKRKKGKVSCEALLDEEIAAITEDKEFLKNFDLSSQNSNSPETSCSPPLDKVQHLDEQYVSNPVQGDSIFQKSKDLDVNLRKDKIITSESMFTSLVTLDKEKAFEKESTADSPEIPILVALGPKELCVPSPPDKNVNESKNIKDEITSNETNVCDTDAQSNILLKDDLPRQDILNTVTDDNLTVTLVIDKDKQDALAAIMQRLGYLLGFDDPLEYSVEKNVDEQDAANEAISDKIVNKVTHILDNKLPLIGEQYGVHQSKTGASMPSTSVVYQSAYAFLEKSKSNNAEVRLLKESSPLSIFISTIKYCYSCNKAILTPHMETMKNDLLNLLTLIDGPFGAISFRDFCSNNCIFQCIFNRKKPRLFWGTQLESNASLLPSINQLGSKGSSKKKNSLTSVNGNVAKMVNTSICITNKASLADAHQKGKNAQNTMHNQLLFSSFRTYRGKKYKIWSSSLSSKMPVNGTGNLAVAKLVTDEQDKIEIYTKHLLNSFVHMSLWDTAPFDHRICLFCDIMGDGSPDKLSRLLNLDIDKWVHLNCALWSSEVYETVSGALMNVETAIKRGAGSYCAHCAKPGATCDCNHDVCNNVYHFPCALTTACTFFDDKTLLCPLHNTDVGTTGQNILTSFTVNRRVFIDRNLAQQISRVMQKLETCTFRIGALIFNDLGQLLPEQLQNFHNVNFIYPIGYRITRYYWDYLSINARVPYSCMIKDVDDKPRFYVQILHSHIKETQSTTTSHELIGGEIFEGSTPKEAWDSILQAIANLRKKEVECHIDESGKLPLFPTKLFPRIIRGEDLFGLSEGHIIRVLESLPGVEQFLDYRFKFGRTQTIELPLTINPSGCARAEPKLRTHFRKPIILSSAPSNHKPMPCSFSSFNFEYGLFYEPTYGKQYGLSKDAQYRKMKSEWKQNIYLGKSRIQGFGLFASRDFGKDVMIIEYIGEIIRCELAEVRERAYHAQNKSTTYLFRLDDDTVLDATICGGPARYINHSCDPNCRAELISISPAPIDTSTTLNPCLESLPPIPPPNNVSGDATVNRPPVVKINKIVIISNRKIQRGEELCYDYKFEYEGENSKISCLCGAHNCKKWMN